MRLYSLENVDGALTLRPLDGDPDLAEALAGVHGGQRSFVRLKVGQALVLRTEDVALEAA